MTTDPVESSIVKTSDGSLTLRSARYGETYRSDRGAISEARQVFLEASGIGTRLREGLACHVLEIGFGVGTTALVTADEALKAGTPLSMVSIENDPVSSAQLRACCHADWLEHVQLLDRLLAAWAAQPAGSSALLLCEKPSISVQLRIEDVCGAVLPTGQFDAVYLDGFSHACNPEPWSPALLARLFAALVPDGVLVTYSSRGQLQRDLRSVGFVVERLPGPAGKRMTLRACKPS